MSDPTTMPDWDQLQPVATMTGDAMSTRPDVLLIMWDQCAAKWVETAETHGVCELPNLRRLRAMGTDYRRCYSANNLADF